jgi:hypothetical protein
MVVMIWLAVVFVWFAGTVLRGAREKFAWGALWSAIFLIGALHFVNPDEYIVRTNIRLMQEGRPFDAAYNSNLSDDAVPVLLESLPAMSFEQQCRVKSKIARRLFEAKNENDFRTWNYARSKARNAITQSSVNLNTSDCPYYTKGYSRSMD